MINLDEWYDNKSEKSEKQINFAANDQMIVNVKVEKDRYIREFDSLDAAFAYRDKINKFFKDNKFYGVASLDFDTMVSYIKSKYEEKFGNVSYFAPLTDKEKNFFKRMAKKFESTENFIKNICNRRMN